MSEAPAYYSEQPPDLTEDEIAERLGKHPEVLERFRQGDATALAELFELGIGAEVVSVEVRELA